MPYLILYINFHLWLKLNIFFNGRCSSSLNACLTSCGHIFLVPVQAKIICWTYVIYNDTIKWGGVGLIYVIFDIVGWYDEVVACGSITSQSKTVWGRYSPVDSKNCNKNSQNNHVIDRFPFIQKHYFFFIRNTTYLTICPKKYLFFTKKL